MHDAALTAELRSSGSVRATAGLAGVTKSFGGTVAVRDVSLELHPGEVLALLGENGAGKSTCVKLLAGVYRPDAGEVVLDGQPVHLHAPLDAQRHGIAVMHQHPGLFPDLSVAENIFIGHAHRPPGPARSRRMRRDARRLLDMVGLAADPDDAAGRLAQLRAAAGRDRPRAVGERPRPDHGRADRRAVAARGRPAVRRGRRSARPGVAMMFVGHRMDEIYRVADRVTVLRDGRLVATAPADEMPRDRAVQLMVGRALERHVPPACGDAPGAVVLAASGLARDGAFADVSFDVRAGEILGFAGLVGSGRTEIARVLFGVDRRDRRDRSGSTAARSPFALAGRRHGGRHRLCLGGPDRPEPGDGFLDPRQRLAAGHRPGDARPA